MMTEPNATAPRQAAADYIRLGWSVIPLKGKVPTGPWAEHQQRRMSLEEIERRRWPGVGVVTGEISDIVVLDADTERAEEALKKRGHPVTPTARTARGLHLYFRHPGGKLPTQVGLGDGLDLKADRGYVAAPPSVHPSGVRYEWIISPQQVEPAELPAWVLDEIRLRGTRRASSADLGEEIPNGSRNKTLFSVAGTLRRRGLDEDAILAALLGINGVKCKPPLPETEVRKIAASVGRYAPTESLDNIARAVEPSGISEGFDYAHSPEGEFDGNKSDLPIKTVDEVISEAGEGPAWIVEGILARGALTEFSGLAKKGGKTTFWLHAIGACARGEAHAGFATVPAKYLYLTEQGNNFAEALRDSGLSACLDNIRIVQFKDVSGVEWDRLINQAANEVKRLEFDALIVDTFAVFARLKGSAENDSGAVADRMRVLRMAAQTKDIAVVLIRHSGKDGTPRGSSAFEAEADICVTISRPEGRHAPNVRKLTGIGRYGEWERNVQLVNDRYVSLGSDDNVEFTKVVRFVKSVLPHSPEEGIRKQDLLDRRSGENISGATLTRALSWLVKQGHVGERQLVDQRGKPKIYWLADRPPGGEQERSIYFDQTPSTYNENDRNESEDGTDRTMLLPEPMRVPRTVNGVYVHDEECACEWCGLSPHTDGNGKEYST